MALQRLCYPVYSGLVACTKHKYLLSLLHTRDEAAVDLFRSHSGLRLVFRGLLRCGYIGIVNTIDGALLHIMVRILQNDVRVCTAESKAVDTGTPGPLAWPRYATGRQGKIPVFKLQFWVDRLDTHCGQYRASLQGGNGSQYSCEPCTTFRMAHSWLDAANKNGVLRSGRSSKGGRYGRKFDWVLVVTSVIPD